MSALDNLADIFTKALVWIRCFFTGHEPAEVQVVVTDCEFKFRHQQENMPEGEIRLSKMKIKTPLYYCRKCGRLRYGP